MKKWLTWPRLIFLTLLTLGLAAWYVPQINADRYREPIHAALERALGRKVTLGEVRFQLLPVPGFTVDHVNIGEDPSIGPEPTAYVDTLRARPTFTALFGGPLEFASVDLEGAYLNLTRTENPATGVRWNFSTLAHSNFNRSSFPAIHFISSRVNFKFGDTKSVFYLLNTDIDLWPPTRADGPWDLRIHGLPARTDRPARGFGSFSARGQWHPADSSLTLDVKLEKSELSDIVTLFQGSEADLHGHIQGDAHLAGPISRVGLAARFTVDDIHGWNQTPPGGGAWPFSVGGYINVPGQVIEIRTTSNTGHVPLDIRYRVSDYLARPRWAITANFSGVSLAPAVGIARNMGLPIPPDMNYDGTAEGAVGFSIPNGNPQWDGEVRVANSTLSVSGAPPLKIAAADLRFAGSSVTLAPAGVENDAHETATLSGSYDLASRQLDASLSSEGMSIPSLRRQISVAGVPVLSQATAGTWSGFLHYSGPQTAWTGDIHLKDADIPFEAFAQPLHLTDADATLNGAGIVVKRFSLTAGDIEAQGDYRYDPTLDRPHRFRVTVARATGESLQKLLMPALHRGNFLNYALNLGAVPQPDWLRALHADGTVQIAALTAGSTQISKLKTRVFWDGLQLRLTAVQGMANDAPFSGLATINLAQRQPQYQFTGKLTGLAWRSGLMDAEGTLTTSGTGLDLLKSLAVKGTFRARDVTLPPLDTWDRIDGIFDWSLSRLKLTQLVMTAGGDTYLGAAETQDDGQISVRASDGTKQIQTSFKM